MTTALTLRSCFGKWPLLPMSQPKRDELNSMLMHIQEVQAAMHDDLTRLETVAMVSTDTASTGAAPAYASKAVTVTGAVSAFVSMDVIDAAPTSADMTMKAKFCNHMDQVAAGTLLAAATTPAGSRTLPSKGGTGSMAADITTAHTPDELKSCTAGWTGSTNRSILLLSHRINFKPSSRCGKPRRQLMRWQLRK